MTSVAHELRPIIIKKIIVAGHHVHHGGAWKIAYADFVTAMMAFFLLMWLLGMTDDVKRKGLADYFAPTLIEMRQNSAGSNGLLGGESIVSRDNYPHRATQTGTRSLTIPRDATGGPDSGSRAAQQAETQRLNGVEQAIRRQLESDQQLRELARNVRLVNTTEGLQIDLMEGDNFAMFALGTDQLQPRAHRLVQAVARSISAVNNAVIVRGHTDGLAYRSQRAMNNWMLSTARAEQTRALLVVNGVGGSRISRIEGVADREPLIAADLRDPRNRRISITLMREHRVTPNNPVRISNNIAAPLAPRLSEQAAER